MCGCLLDQSWNFSSTAGPRTSGRGQLPGTQCHFSLPKPLGWGRPAWPLSHPPEHRGVQIEKWKWEAWGTLVGQLAPAPTPLGLGNVDICGWVLAFTAASFAF